MKRALGLLALAIAGCAVGPPPTTTPVRILIEEPAGQTDRLVVFLRGRSNRPEEFKDAGMFAQARQLWPDARFVAPDLHLGYYYEHTAPQRLHDDVIAPARAAGVRHITLVGISLGGLGALLYELEHPGNVEEIILISPYLGDEGVWREIIAQGGVAAWHPGPIHEDDHGRRLWRDLRTRWSNGSRTIHVQLTCGLSDRFAPANRLFAEAFLGPRDVAWVAGRHNWPTWLRGFAQLTDHGRLATDTFDD